MKKSQNKASKNTAVGCLGAIIIIIVLSIAFVSCGKKSDNGITENDVRAAVMTSTSNELKNRVHIDNFKMKYGDDLKTSKEHNYKNTKTGKIYKNVYYGHGKFTWNNKVYYYSATYSYTNKKLNKYYTLHFSTNANGGLKFKDSNLVEIK